MRISILEEFTRFGGGQTVFGDIYHVLREAGFSIAVVADKTHKFLPEYVPSETVISSTFDKEEWNRPATLLPSILNLKRELPKIVPDGMTLNNHPNVFLYNATINFSHEIFGFMAHRPGPLDRLTLVILRSTGIFSIYRNAFFLVQGEFTKKQTLNTMSALGVGGIKINTIDLPVAMPDSVDLGSKERSVITFGRISPDKELHKVIEMAKHLPETRFTVAGRLIPADQEYYSSLVNTAPGNVSFVPNPDVQAKDKLLSMNKVYFHTKKNENYGISVAEAISYGCFPVVPLEGGTYEDVLRQGEYGSGYSSMEEAESQLVHALDARKSDLERIFESRGRFSRDRFRKNFLSMLRLAKEL